VTAISAETVVVDTDVFSFVLRNDSRARPYLAAMDGKIAAISFQTVAELLMGAYLRGWGDTRLAELQAEMRRYVVVPYHAGMADIWALLMARRQQAGHVIQPRDCWIAATAVWAKAPILTHNQRDFTGIDELEVITFPG